MSNSHLFRYIYVFYRGETVQFVGTDTECAEHFGMNVRSVHWHATPTARRRANEGVDNNKLYAEKVEEEYVHQIEGSTVAAAI